jgi:hypothetical protein
MWSEDLLSLQKYSLEVKHRDPLSSNTTNLSEVTLYFPYKLGPRNPFFPQE